MLVAGAGAGVGATPAGVCAETTGARVEAGQRQHRSQARSSGGHLGESRGGSNLDEVPETVDGEEEVSSLNLPRRRGELVSKEFNKDKAGKLLVLFSRAPFLLVPLAKDSVWS